MTELQQVRLASKHTVSNYKRDLQRFVDFYMQQTQDQMYIHQISREHIQDWLVLGHSQGLAPATLARRLSAVKSIFVFALRHKHCPENPAAGIRAPKLGKRLPKTIPQHQTQALLETTNRKFDSRELALLALLYGCGLRVSEVVGVNMNHLSLNFRQGIGEVRVLGKGNKERIVPLPEVAVALIKDWLQARANLLPKEDAVFLNKFGKRLSVRSVQRMLKDRALETGADMSVTPHKLRHSFATDMLTGGANLRTIQQFLGHASLATTEHYTHVTLPQLQQTYEQAHPRAKVKKHE
ncbi:MAG: tyrosine-type recombinase/integrase [Ghiorsea sp.]|nr:tyrosine-type recombinase/integrase [Ghiorsea sp.]MDQ7059276.1 tyrosine-type recombinase/integrase [Ghiorsea sp.]